MICFSHHAQHIPAIGLDSIVLKKRSRSKELVYQQLLLSLFFTSVNYVDITRGQIVEQINFNFVSGHRHSVTDFAIDLFELYGSMPMMRYVLFQSSLSSIPRCRRHTPQSSKSSWTRGFTSGSMAGVRFALFENKSLSENTIVNKTFFSGWRHPLWLWSLHEFGSGRLHRVHQAGMSTIRPMVCMQAFVINMELFSLQIIYPQSPQKTQNKIGMVVIRGNSVVMLEARDRI